MGRMAAGRDHPTGVPGHSAAGHGAAPRGPARFCEQGLGHSELVPARKGCRYRWEWEAVGAGF